MGFLLALSHHTGIDLAEVGFSLMLIPGVWMVAAEIPQPRWARTTRIVPGTALAIAGVLLIIATHWGQFY